MEDSILFLRTRFRPLVIMIDSLIAQLRLVWVLLQPHASMRCSELLVDLAESGLLACKVLPSHLTSMPIICDVCIGVWHIPGATHIPE